MNCLHLYHVLFWCIITPCDSVVSGVAAIDFGVIALFLVSVTDVSCQFKESCTKTWINLNPAELSLNLRNQVYGQHIVLKAVVRHLKAHMSNDNPTKALALSFHGGAGTGKNFVSKIIANSIYRKGMKSQFVHLFVSTIDFPHDDSVGMYQDKLRYLIEKSVQNCDRSMFIFDEIDTMPPGLLDILKPYLDYYDNLKGVNYRKTIFIFLSNTGGTEIAKTTLDVLRANNDRETIQLRDVEQLIATSAVNSKTGGFYVSNLLLSHMISAYIPFLPLEREHIRKCVKDYLLHTRYYKTAALIEYQKVLEIERELHYFPDKEQFFSSTGCKRVKEKADFVMEDD